MKPELKKLIERIATDPTLTEKSTSSLLEEAFALAETPAEKKEAGEFLRACISSRKRPDIDVKSSMGELTEVLNLAYIAKRYFNKDRTWLYQRLNGSLVNGKPAAFTESELKTLSDSLAEIGHLSNQVSLSFASSTGSKTQDYSTGACES